MRVTKREKTVVIGGLGFLTLLLILQFVVRPTADRFATLRRVVGTTQESLVQLRAMGVEYERLRGEIGHLESRISQQHQSRRILSTIDGIRRASGLSESVMSLKPMTTPIDDKYQKIVVEIRLDGVTFAEFIGFLTHLESLDLVCGIHSLEIQRAERPSGFLRAVVQVATVAPVEGVSHDT
jgi:type II secretory pathway component PulM